MKYIEDELDQFVYTKPDSTRKRVQSQSQFKQPKQLVNTQNIQKGKNKKGKINEELNSIQEMNFKYIWNYIKEHQDSTTIGIRQMNKTIETVLKKPLPEELIIEMFNINNETLYKDDDPILLETIDEDTLKEIFKECKIKI